MHCCGSAVLSDARVRCIRSKWPCVCNLCNWVADTTMYEYIFRRVIGMQYVCVRREARRARATILFSIHLRNSYRERFGCYWPTRNYVCVVHPPERTDKNLCRCFGAPACRVFPGHLSYSYIWGSFDGCPSLHGARRQSGGAGRKVVPKASANVPHYGGSAQLSWTTFQRNFPVERARHARSVPALRMSSPTGHTLGI